MNELSECCICYNKSINMIICKNCCVNKDNPKNICHDCITKLNMNDNFLYKNKIIEDDFVKENDLYDDILIIYLCPFCCEYNDYKITELKNNKNIKDVFISILKNRIIQSYKNDEFLNKVMNENNILKNKVNRLENRLNILNLFNQKYYIILITLIINFSFLLGFTIFVNVN